MSEGSSEAAPQQQSSSVTSAERIQELVEIDQSITRILYSASSGIRALSSHGDSASAPEQSSTNLGQQEQTSPQALRNAFEGNTAELYALIQSVSARLRRQAYALEEANIIAADATTTESEIPPPPTLAQPPIRQSDGRSHNPPANVDPPMPVINGGLGNLDVGWLNSRRDEVGKRKEEELWEEAKDRLQSMLDRQNGQEEMELE